MGIGDGLGGGGFFGRSDAGPSGRFGAWPGCGCSSIIIIIAGLMMAFGGCLRLIGQ